MKTIPTRYIITRLRAVAAVAVAAAALTGCDEDAWNDHLDGFEDEDSKPVTEVKTLDYTLTDADYAAIASNSDNKALAEAAGLAQALKAVGTNHCFSDQVTAADYVPAFLSSTSFQYFTLTDGSAVRLTFRAAHGLPQAVTQAAGASEVLLTEADYQKVWGSEDDYIDAFAPSHAADKKLPGLLRTLRPDAKDGDMVVVTYNQATQEPVFGNVGGGDTPSFELSKVLGTAQVGDAVSVNGLVSGLCTRGYMLTDATGTIYVYYKSGFVPDDFPIGSQVTLEGTVSSYNYGMQIDGTAAEQQVIGRQDYAYPTPAVLDGAAADALVATTLADGVPLLGRYVEISGHMNVSGNYYNLTIPGAAKAIGSAVYPTSAIAAKLATDTDLTIRGWFNSVSSKKYVNVVVTEVIAANGATLWRAPVGTVPTQVREAVYQFNGTSWAVPADFSILQPSDYTEMGANQGYLTTPETYLPVWLSRNLPYAQPDDVRYVVYRRKSGLGCQMYTYDGSAWTLNDGTVTESAQFVRTGGRWLYDPNVTITLPATKGDPTSVLYYQACVDWVYENICKPLGDTSITSGKYYVTKYGNNEYYCGTSAYQCNVDLRPGSARSQYAAGWEGYDDDQIVATEKERFTQQVLPAVLAQLHPDAKPVEGLEVVYTVNFYAYNGSTTFPCQVKYKVVAPHTFEYLDSVWDIK